MWKRGKRSRSNSSTRWPCWASRAETVEPAGPPPITTTSASTARPFALMSRPPFRECPVPLRRHRPEARRDLLRDRDRAHRLARGACARRRSSGVPVAIVLAVLRQHALVADGARCRPRPPGSRTSNSSSKRSARRNSKEVATARPADLGPGGRDAEPGRPPQRVLGLLHVAEEDAEVHEAGRVRLVELDAARRCGCSLTGGSATRLGVADAGVLRQEEAAEQRRRRAAGPRASGPGAPALGLGEVALGRAATSNCARKRSSTSTPYLLAEVARAGWSRASAAAPARGSCAPRRSGDRRGRAGARRARTRPVGLPLVEVLHVHAVHVAERGDAEADQVGALPQAVAVDEARRAPGP